MLIGIQWIMQNALDSRKNQKVGKTVMPLLLRYDAVTTREISHFTLLAVLAFFGGLVS